MVMKWFQRLYKQIVIVVLSVIALPISPILPPPVAQAQAEVPATMLENQQIDDWALAAPRLIWLSYPSCPGPSPALQAAGDPVTLKRIRTTGSDARTIYSRNDPRAPGACNPYRLSSNIVADESYVYWVEGTQLVRLSVNANPGDLPEPWGPVLGAAPVTLAISEGHILSMKVSDCNFCIFGTRFQLISKADGSAVSTLLLNITGSSPLFDGTYIYYKQGNSLYRFLPGDSNSAILIADNVESYTTIGGIEECSGGQIICPLVSYVFYVQGRTIMRYNNSSGARLAVYTSSADAGLIVRLYGLNTLRRPFLGGELFFFEKRYAPCSCFVAPASDLLQRKGISTDAPETIYTRETDSADFADRLGNDRTFLYWGEGAPRPTRIRRLPADAAALPKINLIAEGLEVTQGVQRSDNSVALIQDRRTFVRFFVRSAGQSVPSVSASLQASASGLGSIVLAPVNPGLNLRLTVVPSPNRDSLDQSFLFELPWDFLRAPDLQLRAVVNPFGVPLEPTAADNVATAGPFAFQLSPRLIVNVAAFSYTYQGTAYSVNELRDIAQASSLVRRMFPLASTPGFYSSEPGEIGLRGFRPLVRQITDDAIAARLDYSVSANNTPEICKYLLTFEADGKTVKRDDRNLCATDYVLGRLEALRNEKKLPNNPTYGFIPAPAGLAPRGRARGNGVAAGAADNPLTMAHELAHMLGRNHPFKGSALEPDAAKRVCGNTLADGAIDNSFPYEESKIGPGDGSVRGFDSGSNSFIGGIPARIYADVDSHDIVGYCTANWWVSDYNYRCMLGFMNAAVTPKECGGAAQLAGALDPRPRQAGGPGDWLSVVGLIGAGGAELLHVRRVADVADTPERQPGAYSLHLLDAAGTLLADYPFTPRAGHHASAQDFALVVPFVEGTRELRLVTTAPLGTFSGFFCEAPAGSAVVAQGPLSVLASVAISSSPPQLSDVALQSPPTPLSGVVTLGWNASDPDGDPLRFDVLYSRDDGASFVPIQLGLESNSLAIDTAKLGGGPTIFQVIASDGAQSAQANSQPASLEASAPTPHILTPGDGARLQWGQVVNFSAEASDLQDGSLSGAQLVWSDRRGSLGTGAQFSTSDLLVGTSVITLTATNSAGLSASTAITIEVGDDLSDPGPILSASAAALAFSVAPGTTAAQTAQLQISNAGGGGLSWAISSDAPWLQVSAASGDAPATLTVSADPSGFAEGQVARATLTISSATGGVQPLSVPVTLTVGSSLAQPLPPGELVGRNLYLPMVRR
jgi:Viral BACON domain